MYKIYTYLPVASVLGAVLKTVHTVCYNLKVCIKYSQVYSINSYPVRLIRNDYIIIKQLNTVNKSDTIHPDQLSVYNIQHSPCISYTTIDYLCDRSMY